MSIHEHCSMNSKVHFCKCRKHTYKGYVQKWLQITAVCNHFKC